MIFCKKEIMFFTNRHFVKQEISGTRCRTKALVTKLLRKEILFRFYEIFFCFTKYYFVIYCFVFTKYYLLNTKFYFVKIRNKNASRCQFSLIVWKTKEFPLKNSCMNMKLLCINNVDSRVLFYAKNRSECLYFFKWKFRY
jgi:hypothetical protein